MIASFREREIVWGLKIPILDALASYHQVTGPWQRTTIASYNLNIEASFCVRCLTRLFKHIVQLGR